MEHGDVCVAENLAIMRYLAKVFPDKAGKFIPSDPAAAAKADMIADYVGGSIYPKIAEAMSPIEGFGSGHTTQTTSAEDQAAAAEALLSTLNDKVVNIFLKDSTFLAGDSLTIADFRFAPVLLFAKIAIVLPARIEEYLNAVEAAAPGYAASVAPVDGFCADKYKK
jgi:glutathione S-transferase